MSKIKVKIVDKGYKINRDVYIFVANHDNTVDMYYSDRIDRIEDGAISKPSFEMSPEMLQEFSNALSAMGINPTKEYTQGRLEATEKHLEDMRNLVFKPNEKAS